MEFIIALLIIGTYAGFWQDNYKKMMYWHKILFAWIGITLIYIIGFPFFAVRTWWKMLVKYKQLHQKEWGDENAGHWQ